MSDELNPRRVAAVTLGDRGSESEALDEHKAFQFWSRAALRAAGTARTRGVFALPASVASLARARAIYDADDWRVASPWASGLDVFQGLVVFDDRLDLVGNVTHHVSDFFAPTLDGGSWRTYRNSRESGDHVTRSLRRGDDLFTFSDNAVRKTSLDGADVRGAADLAAGFNASEYDDGGSYYGGFYGGIEPWYWDDRR